MSVNRNQPHVLVLPEDKANADIAQGFHLALQRLRQMQILDPAGGWLNVLDCFESVHVAEMARYRNRSMILLIDLDEDSDRLPNALARIPGHLTERVFILGVWSDPEAAEGRSRAIVRGNRQGDGGRLRSRDQRYLGTQAAPARLGPVGALEPTCQADPVSGSARACQQLIAPPLCRRLVHRPEHLAELGHLGVRPDGHPQHVVERGKRPAGGNA